MRWWPSNLTRRQRVEVAILLVIVSVLSIALYAWLSGREARAGSAAHIMLEACQADLSMEEANRIRYQQRLKTERTAHRLELIDREETWRGIYDDVKAEKAGAWCWEALKDAEAQVEGEQRMCLWRLKSARVIKYKTDKAVGRLDKAIKAAGIDPPLLTVAEEVKLED